MIHVPDPLDTPVTLDTLRHQARHGMLDQTALRRAFVITGHTPANRDWIAFLNIGLLISGAILLVSGIIFFFAFNWQGMHRFLKLGILEGSVIITLGLAVWLGLDRLVGKVALTSAALLIGATLAVYGQIYQTGADAYQLFLTWAVIITPWVFVSKFVPLWGIWLGLLNISILVYPYPMNTNPERIFGMIFGLNGFFFALTEWIQDRKIEWLDTRWIPRALAIPMLGSLLIMAITFSIGDQERTGLLSILFLLFIGISGLMFYWYSIKLFDPFMIIIVGFAICTWFDTWLFTTLDLDEIGLLLAAILILGQTAGIVTWIRRRSETWRIQHHGI